MKKTVRVAAVQMEVQWLDPEANAARMGEAMERIMAQGGADLVVFPELANSGYLKGRESKDFAHFTRQYVAVAERVPGPFTEALCHLAQRYSTYLVSGLLEAHPQVPGTLYNSAILISPAGQVVGLHHKAHIPAEEKHYFYPGNTAEVFATDLGNLGMMVCADNSFPELARVLTLRGAEIICVPYNRPQGLYPNPEQIYRLISCRACENGNFFIAVNRVGSEGRVVFEGKSCICGPSGEMLALSEGAAEDLLLATLEAEELVTARMKYSRFRDRRPELYGALTEPF